MKNVKAIITKQDNGQNRARMAKTVQTARLPELWCRYEKGDSVKKIFLVVGLIAIGFVAWRLDDIYKLLRFAGKHYTTVERSNNENT
jgi:hypothetical protein